MSGDRKKLATLTGPPLWARSFVQRRLYVLGTRRLGQVPGPSASPGLQQGRDPSGGCVARAARKSVPRAGAHAARGEAGDSHGGQLGHSPGWLLGSTQ